VRFGPGLDEVGRLILADAQTSGGLLIAVPPEREAALVDELTRRRAPACAPIGEIVAGEPGFIEVE
jgi:selenide,water dikinase